MGIEWYRIKGKCIMTEKVKTDKLGRTGKSIGGRPTGSQSKASLRQSKLKNILLRHMEPLAVEAITTTSELMRDKDASPTVRLQASKFIIERIADLIDEAYGRERDQVDDPKDNEDDEPRGAVLSFSIVDQKK
jgi:hypothetical protein